MNPLSINRQIMAVGPVPSIEGGRGVEMARGQTPTAPTGYPPLDRELPGGGWPRGAPIELMLRQAGIGKMQLIAPVLAQVSKLDRVAFVHPPYLPQVLACQSLGLNPSNLLLVKAKATADLLWASEKILKSPGNTSLEGVSRLVLNIQ